MRGVDGKQEIYLEWPSIPYGCQESVEWNGGMEYWNGIVE